MSANVCCLKRKVSVKLPQFLGNFRVQSAVWRFPFWSFWKIELLLYDSASFLWNSSQSQNDGGCVRWGFGFAGRRPCAECDAYSKCHRAKWIQCEIKCARIDSFVSEFSAFATPSWWCTHSSNSIYGWTSENGINANYSNISFTTVCIVARIRNFPLFAYAKKPLSNPQ